MKLIPQERVSEGTGEEIVAVVQNNSPARWRVDHSRGLIVKRWTRSLLMCLLIFHKPQDVSSFFV